MHARPLFRIRHLTVEAGSQSLPTGLDLDLHAGEIVALRGSSHSDRTSLLRALAGLQDPADGCVTLHDKTPQRMGWSAWRRGVILVPQQPVMLADTVGEELANAVTYRGNLRRFNPDRAADLLSALFLDSVKLDNAPQNLSLGRQQRLALVRALLLEPEVLLLDEPIGTMDDEAAEAVHRVIRAEVIRRPAGALVVTQDISQHGHWYDRDVDLLILGAEAHG